MTAMRLVILIIGVLLVAIGIIQDGLSERNEWAAGGLFLFSWTASTYFLTWPVSRDDQRNWRFNPEFAWLLIDLVLGALGAVWLWLLFR
jgi:hypothetical protein